MMIVLITDPATNGYIAHPNKRIYFIQGSGRTALKIYFESQDSKNKYLQSTSLKKRTTNA